MLHHVLTHLLTSTCTQIPVRERRPQTHTHHSVGGDSLSDMLLVFMCLCVRACVSVYERESLEVSFEQRSYFDIQYREPDLRFTGGQ